MQSTKHLQSISTCIIPFNPQNALSSFVFTTLNEMIIGSPFQMRLRKAMIWLECAQSELNPNQDLVALNPTSFPDDS